MTNQEQDEITREKLLKNEFEILRDSERMSKECPECSFIADEEDEAEVHWADQHPDEGDFEWSDWEELSYPNWKDYKNHYGKGYPYQPRKFPPDAESKEVTLRTKSKLDADATATALTEISDDQLRERIAQKKKELLDARFMNGLKTDSQAHKAEKDIAGYYAEGFLRTHFNALNGKGYSPLSQKVYEKILSNLSKQTKLILPKSTAGFDQWDELASYAYDMIVTDLTTEAGSQEPQHETVEVKDPMNKEQCSEEQLSKMVESSKSLTPMEKGLLRSFLDKQRKRKEELSKTKSWFHA